MPLALSLGAAEKCLAPSLLPPKPLHKQLNPSEPSHFCAEQPQHLPEALPHLGGPLLHSFQSPRALLAPAESRAAKAAPQTRPCRAEQRGHPSWGCPGGAGAALGCHKDARLLLASSTTRAHRWLTVSSGPVLQT